MSPKPISFAFVSGKGGVGKTVLAANFAWVCSQIAKTVLVDLDFQNQGGSGLFAPHIVFGPGNALEAIQHPRRETLQELNEVAERLYFLPAVSWQKPPSQEEMTRYVNANDFQHKLVTFIEQLGLTEAFEIVVLDCHGGVDAVSLAAFQSCDYTLMVTEADSVTFAGTLELLNYYETKSSQIHSTVTSDAPSHQPPPEAIGQVSMDSWPRVKFIVNRLSSKYKWKDLEQIYQRYFSRKLGIFTQDRSVFCYIPSEELLADSFGEYPFHVKLAPRSNFSKKVHYMAYHLLHDKCDFPAKYKPLTKFGSNRYMRKVERIVVSNESKNTTSVMKFFAWFSTLYAIALIVFIPVAIALSIRPTWAEYFIVSSPKLYLVPIILFGVAITVPIAWYGFKAIFGLMFFYRDKHKFQKALFRLVTPKLTLWQRLSLAQLFFLRIGTSIIPYFMIFYFGSLIIGLGAVSIIGIIGAIAG